MITRFKLMMLFYERYRKKYGWVLGIIMARRMARTMMQLAGI